MNLGCFISVVTGLGGDFGNVLISVGLADGGLELVGFGIFGAVRHTTPFFVL